MMPWKECLLLAPNITVLLGRLIKDPRVPERQKVLLIAAAAYLVSPIDLIPDFIPFIGHLDDLLVILIVFDGIANRIDPAILQEHWRGAPETLARLQKWARRLSSFVPDKLKSKLFETRK